MAKIVSKKNKSADVVIHLVHAKDLKKLNLSKDLNSFVQQEFAAKRNLVFLPSTLHAEYVQCADIDWNAKGKESARKWGVEIQQVINRLKKKTLMIVNHTLNNEISYCVAEGAALSNYQFLKYRSDRKKKQNSFENIFVQNANEKGTELQELMGIVEGTELARTLINEPVSFLNAPQFAKEMQAAGKKAGFKTQVLNKK
ncbi:MAG: hypothetical protein ACKO8Q_10095, partial [Bacteroidota bacterium]